MDIRAWLKPMPKKTTEKKKRRIEDDDDEDVIPGSPDVQIINKKTKTSHTSAVSKNKNKTSNDKPLVEVKTANLFGSGPIKRTEPIVKKNKKETETGIHSDEEFEKSLLEIDGLDQLESNGNDEKNKQNNLSKSPIKVSSLKDTDPSTKKSLKSPIKSQSNNAPSTSRDSNKHSTSKKVDDIKKEIKDTNKRKFAEFLEDDEQNFKIQKHDTNKLKDVKNDTEASKMNGHLSSSEKHDATADDSVLEDHEDSKSKKRRVNKSLNESVLTDEERHERKMYSAKLYQSYLNRSGPKHLGAKEMPEGTPNCLKDMAFLLTGVLDSFEREEIVETINKYGGCIKNSVTKKVTHVLVGEEAGPAKMAKAKELNIKIITEDDFIKMIRDSNETKVKIEPQKEVKHEKDHSRKSSRENEKDKKSYKDSTHTNRSSDHKSKHSKSESHRDKSGHREKQDKHIVKEKTEHKQSKDSSKDNIEIKKEKSEHKQSKDSSKNKLEVKSKNHGKTKSPLKVDKDIKFETESKSNMDINTVDEHKSPINTNQIDDTKSNIDANICGIMWVEKYKPQNVKQIIGQQGENSNVNKLINWLTKWYVNRKSKLPKPSPWAKNDDGGYYKAALLSGPPGIGKTTTVSLVCKQLGFDMVEFNASDTRNKALIKEQIGELLTTTSLSAYAKGETGKQAVTKKHVLVMDEVDGMAGNEDRGGLQELIGLIKTTSVPIICMCNDRNSQKMRSLVNYCYDLRFSRPRVEQIKSAMRSICCKENIKIPPDVLEQLIVASNQDVRQTLNTLALWAADKTLLEPERLAGDAVAAKKDVKLGPWEAIRKVFSAEDHKKMKTINEKSDLFFYDYSLAPLFVQENYLQAQPHCPKHEVLQRISEAADCISFGDIIEKRIRSYQNWNLLPIQAMYSSVLPGHFMAGHLAGQIQFPAWLGKNSRAGKMQRLGQDIHAHTRLSTTGSKSSIFLDYAFHLRDAIITPLIKDKADGVERSLELLESYNLLREDLDSLTELSVWPGQRNPMVLIDPKVKAAMTRTYNKKASALPYAPGSIKRARTREDEEAVDYEETADDEEEDSDLEHDALIKKKKQPEKPSSSDKPSSSKGKSNNKGASSSKGKKK